MTMNCTQRQYSVYVIAALSLLAACTGQPSRGPSSIPAHAVVGVQPAQLRPEFWIAREASARKVVLDARAIAEQNARLLRLDPSVHDLERLPATLSAAEVRAHIEKLSQYPDEPMFDADGQSIQRPQLEALMNAVAIETVPENQRTRHGL